jgi:hypothetical protein
MESTHPADPGPYVKEVCKTLLMLTGAAVAAVVALVMCGVLAARAVATLRDDYAKW